MNMMANEPFDGDLHIHSRYSDGTLFVKELVPMAAKAGLSVMALTDHDTMAGWEEAVALGERYRVTVIPGVEFSTRDPATGRKAHLLVYGPKKPELLQPLCDHMAQERRKNAEQMIEKISQQYPIDRDLVLRCAQGCVTLFKQHIMLALREAGVVDRLYGPLFRELFGRGGCAYVPTQYPDVHEVARAARASGGVVVLAHPGEYRSLELLRHMAQNGEVDGAEYWHPRNTADDQEEIAAIAAEFSLLLTGGTDFHGSNSDPPHPLGTFRTPRDTCRQLMDRIKT